MPRPKGPIERNIRLNMTLSDDERDLVERLAARERLTISDYVRRLLYREGEKHLGWTPHGTKKGGKGKKTRT
jgi:hypothetical protein